MNSVDVIRRQAIEDVLGALTAHELYRYRPKAFDGFIEYARSALLSSTSAGVTEEQTPRDDDLLAALRKAETHIALTSGNGETDLRNELKAAIAKAEASFTCHVASDEMVEAALNVKPFDDGDENVQYILLRGLSAMGFKLPSHATWDVMRAALEASRSPVSQKEAEPVAEALCSDCPPFGYLPDETRCTPCPRRSSAPAPAGEPAPFSVHQFTGDGPGIRGADNCQICGRWGDQPETEQCRDKLEGE